MAFGSAFGAGSAAALFGGGAAQSFGAPAAPAFGAQSASAFGAPATTAFGAPAASAFGAQTQSAFGAPSQSAFGAPSQSAFGAPSQSAFGAQSQSAFGAPSQSAFGAPATSAFGAPAASAFGAPSQSAFGAPAQSTFGAPAASGFGAASASAFGAPTTSGFGAPAASAFGAPAASSFGAPAAAGFGAAGTSAFGAPAAPAASGGTRGVKWQLSTLYDTNSSDSGKYVSISAMQQFRDMSVEELRAVDYARGDKGGPAGAAGGAGGAFGGGGGAFGGAAASTPGLFGASGQSAGGLFGGGAASQPASGLFGSGSGAAAGGAFGAPAAGGFGAASAGSFGAPAAATSGGLFGAPAASSGGGLFGAPAPASGGLFGAAPAGSSGGGLFGGGSASAPAANTGGLFGGGAASKPAGSLFGGGGSSLFGAGQSAPAANVGGFGSTGSAFGGGGLFGASGSAPATGTSGLFGAPVQQATGFGASTPSGGLFGGGFGAPQTQPSLGTGFGGGFGGGVGLGSFGSSLLGGVGSAGASQQMNTQVTDGPLQTSLTMNPFGASRLFEGATAGAVASRSGPAPSIVSAPAQGQSTPLSLSVVVGNSSGRPSHRSRPPNSLTRQTALRRRGPGSGFFGASPIRAWSPEGSLFSVGSSHGRTTPARGRFGDPKTNSSFSSQWRTPQQISRAANIKRLVIEPVHRESSQATASTAYGNGSARVQPQDTQNQRSAEETPAPMRRAPGNGSFIGQGNGDMLSVGTTGRQHNSITRTTPARSVVVTEGDTRNNPNAGSAVEGAVHEDDVQYLDSGFTQKPSVSTHPVKEEHFEVLEHDATHPGTDRQAAQHEKNGGTPRILAPYIEFYKHQMSASKRQHSAGRKPDVPTGQPPVTTQKDLYTRPGLDELAAMSTMELQHITNFAVGRPGIGEVEWIGETDVTDLDLDRVIELKPREVALYPNQADCPPVGTKLNKPARVRLSGIWKMDKKIKSPIKDASAAAVMVSKLKAHCERQGLIFLGYDVSSGTWTIQASSF